jgi:hypothetical protein
LLFCSKALKSIQRTTLLISALIMLDNIPESC